MTIYHPYIRTEFAEQSIYGLFHRFRLRCEDGGRNRRHYPFDKSIIVENDIKGEREIMLNIARRMIADLKQNVAN